jgi:drug/metabolite transporter (DMT)-like permease
VLGFVGVAMVVSGKLGSGFGLAALWPALAALAGITAGTLYQKRFCPQLRLAHRCHCPVPAHRRRHRRGGRPQRQLPRRLGARLHLRPGLAGAGAVAGRHLAAQLLIRRGSAVNLASLFYLVPPCTALIAWFLFDERLAGMALVGMALAVWGVYLARK